MVGDHGGFARADRLEEVAVGHQAKPLLPGVVFRGEVLGHVEIGRQLLAHQREQTGLRFLGLPAADVVEPGTEGDVFQAHQRMDQLARQKAREPVSERIFGRARDHIGRRSLQHGHMRRVLCHRGHQGHCGCAAADHDHPLAGPVDVVGPLLGMHDATLEGLDAREMRRVTVFVVVVAGAHEEKVAAQLQGLGALAIDVDRPGAVERGPARAADTVAEADVPIDAELAHRLVQIGADGVGIADRLGGGPGFEAESEGIHVGVGADAGIAKQVPGPTDVGAGLEDRPGLAGALILKVVSRADAGNPGTHYQDIEMFDRHVQTPTKAGKLRQGRARTQIG